MQEQCMHHRDFIIAVKLLDGKEYHICRGCGNGLSMFDEDVLAQKNAEIRKLSEKIRVIESICKDSRGLQDHEVSHDSASGFHGADKWRSMEASGSMDGIGEGKIDKGGVNRGTKPKPPSGTPKGQGELPFDWSQNG